MKSEQVNEDHGFSTPQSVRRFGVTERPPLTGAGRRMERYRESSLTRGQETWPWDVRALLVALNDRIFDEELAVGREINRLRLSRKVIAARFAYYVGLTPKRYILAHRIEMARLLISEEKLSKTLAGLCVGFSSCSAFLKAARRYQGEELGTNATGI